MKFSITLNFTVDKTNEALSKEMKEASERQGITVEELYKTFPQQFLEGFVEQFPNDDSEFPGLTTEVTVSEITND
ncbi:hypothetical protein A71_96 [Escherichia phage A7_1]|nr:hypothetical protein A71_96 [Escherichia phage A7_1]